MYNCNIIISPNWKRETIYFYDYGKHLETGGYRQSYYSNVYGSQYVKFDSDNIYFQCDLYGDITYTSKNMVDLTGLKTIKVYFNWTSDWGSRYGYQGSGFTLGINKSNSANRSSSFNAEAVSHNIPSVGLNVITANVSNLEGSYYIHLIGREWNQQKNVRLKIYQIYGEG